MKKIWSSPVSKAFWLFAKTLGSTVTAVVGAEVAKRAMRKFNHDDDSKKWEQKAQAQEEKVQELQREVADLQQRVHELKSQAFSVPWPPMPPENNPTADGPIIEGQAAHFPKGEP
ncbi:MAG: hypothetical protein CMH56_09220 [Myxococcales bacterium]|nr:hypothetical protein [Myxococcales bacterium]